MKKSLILLAVALAAGTVSSSVSAQESQEYRGSMLRAMEIDGMKCLTAEFARTAWCPGIGKFDLQWECPTPLFIAGQDTRRQRAAAKGVPCRAHVILR